MSVITRCLPAILFLIFPSFALAVALEPMAVDLAVGSGVTEQTTFLLANTSNHPVTYRLDVVSITIDDGIPETAEAQAELSL